MKIIASVKGKKQNAVSLISKRRFISAKRRFDKMKRRFILLFPNLWKISICKDETDACLRLILRHDIFLIAEIRNSICTKNGVNVVSLPKNWNLKNLLLWKRRNYFWLMPWLWYIAVFMRWTKVREWTPRAWILRLPLAFLLLCSAYWNNTIPLTLE